MSDTKHTPEPWLVNFNSMSVPTISAEYERIALVDTCGGDGPANASRIVACVNACKGMADPESEIAKLKAEREELLEAVEAYMQLSNCYRLGGKPTEKLFAALSKARAALGRIKEV